MQNILCTMHSNAEIGFRIICECNEKSCDPFSVPGGTSLRRAKSNVEKYYSVVGMLEDLPNFVRTLEYIFPQYFTGATKLYTGTARLLVVK